MARKAASQSKNFSAVTDAVTELSQELTTLNARRTQISDQLKKLQATISSMVDNITSDLATVGVSAAPAALQAVKAKPTPKVVGKTRGRRPTKDMAAVATKVVELLEMQPNKSLSASSLRAATGPIPDVVKLVAKYTNREVYKTGQKRGTVYTLK